MSKVRLNWGIKASLLAYIRGLPDGTVEVSGGAEALGDTFAFNLDVAASSFDAATFEGTLQFLGSVTFTGHWKTMRIAIAEPKLAISNRQVELSIYRKSLFSGPEELVIATGNLDPGARTVSLYLASEGRKVFGQQYQIGQEFEPAVIVME